MRSARLFVESRADAVATLSIADRFVERLVGLLRHDRLDASHGLWIAPCGSVHTIGMRFAIDVLFVDRHGCIVKVAASLAPRRFAFARGATSVVELPAGDAARLGLAPGLRLSCALRPDGSRTPLVARAFARVAREASA